MAIALFLALQDQQPRWVYAIVLGGIALIGGGLYWLDRWDKKKHGGRRNPTVTRAGNAFMELQTLLEPGKRHVIVAKETKKTEQDGEGDDDDTSRTDDLSP